MTTTGATCGPAEAEDRPRRPAVPDPARDLPRHPPCPAPAPAERHAAARPRRLPERGAEPLEGPRSRRGTTIGARGGGSPVGAPTRRAALALLALPLAGCGFRPMFAEGGSAAGLANAVRVVGLDGRTGFAFRQQLRQRLGDPGPDAPYLLEAELEYADRALDISPDADITRYDVIGLVRYRLLGEGGTELDAGELTAFSAYSTLANPYATEIAERDAERRVARELANRVFGRLAAALARA